MLERIAQGELPAKPHTALRNSEGRLLYEHCITRQGFEGAYTVCYHLGRPHELTTQSNSRYQLRAVQAAGPSSPERRHFRTARVKRADQSPLFPATQTEAAGCSPLVSRVPLLFNEDVVLSVAHPSGSDTVYASNADGDELLFIQRGAGKLRTPLGDVAFRESDYLFVPRGLLHRFELEAVPQHWLSLEFTGALGIPSHLLTALGQLKLEAPYSHRDFRRPVFQGPVEEGIRELFVKRGHNLFAYTSQHSLLDVIGYDGALYPFAFSILDFQPKVGLVHLPPSTHATFRAPGAWVLSFVPRPLDFHPHAVPCPYPHSSVDVDEVLFYSRGNFTSRRGIEAGSVSFHPAGLPHGPHPGAYEESPGSTHTEELAVMVDCERPLLVTSYASSLEDEGYADSF